MTFVDRTMGLICDFCEKPLLPGSELIGKVAPPGAAEESKPLRASPGQLKSYAKAMGWKTAKRGGDGFAMCPRCQYEEAIEAERERKLATEND